MKASRAVIFPAASAFIGYAVGFATWVMGLSMRFWAPAAITSIACVILVMYFIVTHSPSDELKSVKDFFRRF